MQITQKQPSLAQNGQGIQLVKTNNNINAIGGISNGSATNNSNSQQTQVYINQAQNPNNDAILTQMYLNNAKTNALKKGGSTYNQQDQIRQIEQTQQQNINNIGNQLTSLVNSLNEESKRKANYERQEKVENEEATRQSKIYQQLNEQRKAAEEAEIRMGV